MKLMKFHKFLGEAPPNWRTSAEIFIHQHFFRFQLQVISHFLIFIIRLTNEQSLLLTKPCMHFQFVRFPLLESLPFVLLA